MLPQEPSRSIVISTVINEQVAGDVVAQIMDINAFDAERSQIVVNGQEYNPEPIELFINSVGGNVTDGFAIIGAMEMSRTPIITYGMGIVASMALAIFIAGDIRIAHRFTRFMYHSISYGMMGHITEHEAMREEADLLQRMYNSLIFDRTDLSKEQVDEIRAMKKDFYFSGKEAKKFGVADEVLKKPEKKYELPSEEQLEELAQNQEEKPQLNKH